MIALSEILGARKMASDKEESLRLQERASEIYEERQAILPELVSGHAVEYFLKINNDSRALAFAQENYHNRPGGQAALLLVQAHSAMDQMPKAFALLESVLATEYQSASLYATAGLLYQFKGDVHSAKEYNKKALEISPLAIVDMDWFRSKLYGQEKTPAAI
jgi:tetratricopeptide (TPR) repeat protein